MHKRVSITKTNSKILTSGKIFKKENMYNQCFHSISIEGI